MSAVAKLLGIFGTIILAQCLAIFLVELMGPMAILLTVPIGIFCGIVVCTILNK